MTLKGASHFYWLHQLRSVHLLFWSKPIKVSRWDNSQQGIFVTDLRNKKTELVLEGTNIVEYVVSTDAKKIAVFTTTEFSILDIASQKSQGYLTNTRVLTQTNIFEDRSVGILGWSKDNKDVWFYVDDRSPIVAFYRWRANAITRFDYLREFYMPGLSERVDRYLGEQRRQLFNPTHGFVLHFKEWQKKKLFLTDLVHEKTVFVGMAMPGMPYSPIPQWTGETTFTYKLENGDIAKGDALALLGLPKENALPRVPFRMIVAAAVGAAVLALLLFVVTLLLRGRRKAG